MAKAFLAKKSVWIFVLAIYLIVATLYSGILSPWENKEEARQPSKEKVGKNRWKHIQWNVCAVLHKNESFVQVYHSVHG